MFFMVVIVMKFKTQVEGFRSFMMGSSFILMGN